MNHEFHISFKQRAPEVHNRTMPGTFGGRMVPSCQKRLCGENLAQIIADLLQRIFALHVKNNQPRW